MQGEYHSKYSRKMELLTKSEIETIVEKCGFVDIQSLKWSIEDYSSELIGYLGEHLRLTVTVECKGTVSEINFFLKCIPRLDKWKAEHLRETTFFKKEYAMLNGLFKHFKDYEGEKRWRPKLLYIKEELFVFEDVTKLGYVMPNQIFSLSKETLMATVVTLARFHAQSYIYEETKSRKLNRTYRIWEEYGEYLTEPPKSQPWRDAGKRAVIDYLTKFSAYKLKPGFRKDIEIVINMLFDQAINLMKPSSIYRNVVVHRDIWSNNIFLKKLNSGRIHSLLIDFQTVIYCSPMLDLSSLLFFNTTKKFRRFETDEVIKLYYSVLSEELKLSDIDVNSIIDKDKLKAAYEESVVFGITQAALVVPFTTMSDNRRKEIFGDDEIAKKVNVVSRSEEFIETATHDANYRNRVTELFDDIVERFVYPLSTEKNSIKA